MLKQKLLLAGLVWTLLFLAGDGTWCWSADPPQADPERSAADARIKELLKERLATLKEVAALVEKDYQNGQVPLERSFQARHIVLEAELELSETDKDRIAVLEKMVALGRQWEDHAKKMSQAGQIQARDVLLAKVNRLEAEIALERARGK